MAATDDELDRLQRRALSEEDISRLGQGCIICISGFVMGEIITTLPCSCFSCGLFDDVVDDQWGMSVM